MIKQTPLAGLFWHFISGFVGRLGRRWEKARDTRLDNKACACSTYDALNIKALTKPARITHLYLTRRCFDAPQVITERLISPR